MSKVLGVVPARGGSKGIPRKNIKDFEGKPLLAWTLEAALESRCLNRLIVSTDDPEIAQVAKAHGAEVPFLRPEPLANDSAPTAPAIRHALDWLSQNEHWRPDYVVVLEPTAPLRQARHIREALGVLVRSGMDSVASVSKIPHHYVPPKALMLQPDGSMLGWNQTPLHEMVHRRQELETYYALDGLIFGCKTACLMQQMPTLWGNKVIPYLVDSQYNVDLDRPEDWSPAEIRLQQLLQQRVL